MTNFFEKIGSFLSSKHPSCPNCNARIGILDRPEKCAICDKSICSTCIKYERFCDKCADKVPKFYQKQYGWLNGLSVIFWLCIGLSLIGIAWWKFPGWQLTNISDNLIALIVPIGFIVLGLIITIFAPHVPKLGTWLFYLKMKNDKYRNEIADTIEGRTPKHRFSLSRFIFNIKEKIINWQIKTKFKSTFIFGFLLNGMIFLLLIAYFTTGKLSEDTFLSNIAGIIFIFSIFWNYLTLFLAAAFYSDKSKQNRSTRLFIELISWSYAFILPFSFLEFVVGCLIQFQYIKVLSVTVGISLIHGSQGMFRLSTILIFILQIFLLLKKPNLDRKSNNKGESEHHKNFFQWLIFAFFALLVFIGFLLSILVLITDVLYIFNVTGYLINFIYLFFIFGAIKLADYKIEKHGKIHLSKDVIAKLGAVILIINIIPTIGTTLGTNFSLDRQFATVFGDNWNQEIESSGIPIKHLPYSSWDAFFGYPQIPSNGHYGILYGTDNPRFVIDPITGNPISNGSEKYPSVVHEFKFDLYLPAGEPNGFFPVNLKPGDGNPKKYPLVLMIHGLGADRGPMNANITSQVLANYGYAVCDVSFGDFGWYNASEVNPKLEKGYDLPDTIFQVAQFLQFIESNSDYYHVNVSNTAIVGRSWGGFMSLVIAYSYEHPFFAGNFSSNLHINSLIVFYPTSKILTAGERIFELGDILSFVDEKTPIIRGSDDPDSIYYNPQWKYFDPFYLSGTESGLLTIPNTLIFQGTHDFGIPPAWSRDLETHLRENNRKVIAGYYPLGAHGFDAVTWSHFGQSTLYYMSRFILLSSK